MRVGIDLGTTRTIVAAADRGNFPVVGFGTPGGDVVEHFPSISAEVDGKLRHGHAAVEAVRSGAPYVRSWKRLLGRFGPEHTVRIGCHETTLLDLTTSFLRDLGDALLTGSNLPGAPSCLPDAVISVPANAHSTQRFITLEAFRRAGFSVVAMVNEPSAAAIEFAHRYRGNLNKKREHVCVYDLGGGTFDAALVVVASQRHDVIDSSGVQELGGDDFDTILMEMALEQLDVHPYEVPDQLGALLDECRTAKESIGPNTRRIVLELDALGAFAADGPAVIKVADYYQRLEPLVARTIEALAEVMALATGDVVEPDLKKVAAVAGVAGVYVVGGGSGLPLVTRRLREHFGRRVHRSTYPAASTAMGLAIAGEAADRPPLTERFTRHFGVFRERNAGAGVAFDGVFPRGTLMPAPGAEPLQTIRRYRAMHNVGHFRFIECAKLEHGHEPGGDISPHNTIHFPFAREARHGAPVNEVPIRRLDGLGPLIEERFEVDAAGVIAVTIVDLEDGYSERFVL